MVLIFQGKPRKIALAAGAAQAYGRKKTARSPDENPGLFNALGISNLVSIWCPSEAKVRENSGKSV